ncbi:MAG: 2Fe-2S iron-sulfur cluster-binding protein [Zetaproteobacteria bacterium]|nr:2Fe-2S iron-sulfur cluster-binding protein [Zetaproteobacteria bacterium]
MTKIVFLPTGEEVQPETGLKILVAAIRQKVEIRYGCAACRCGTCAVAIREGGESLSPMEEDERALLGRMGLVCDGSIRLACRAKILVAEGAVDVTVDIDFQQQYSPDRLEGR